MALRLFNTYSREIEEFAPIAPPAVKMYTCGPTVYSHAHIGNFRAYIFEDLLHRHLESRGYKVHRVMNLTDVDDKTIRGCREAGIPLDEFTAQFKKAFFADLDTLRIKRAGEFPAATDARFVSRMVAMISQLMSRDLAYKADDNSLYFRIKNFAGYGRLAHFNVDELQSTGRVRNDEYDKEHVGDFALWKAWDEADGDVSWDSPWGRGRPGWHIECSAMATELLGEQIDIHCGGVDNIFPHHEAEIAQTEGVTGKKFVRYWSHCAHLLVDGAKMSKSAGNFFTLRDVIARGYTGREVRYALLRVHYRAQLNFTFDGLAEARTSLARIDDWVRRLRAMAGTTRCDVQPTQRADPTSNFRDALDDDLNISDALAVLFEIIRETNRALDHNEMDGATAVQWLKWWDEANATLQLEEVGGAEIPQEILQLGDERIAARLAKDWRRSDELRDELATRGWDARDTKDGQQLTRRAGIQP